MADSPQALIARARRWLASEALADLSRELGGPADPASDNDALLRWSAATLDTRAGRERRDAAPVRWSGDWIRALIAAGEELGLMRTADPVLDSYDALLVMGGATTGNRLRMSLTTVLMRSGLRAAEVVLLAAERPLGDQELEEEEDSAFDRTEWRNLARYAAEELGPFDTVESRSGGADNLAWHDILYRSAGPPVRVLVAPSSDPKRRSSTGDAVGFFAERIPLAARRQVLLITSAIYAPYQFFSASPLLLASGVHHVELVGTSTSRDGQSVLLAQRLGQETHAAIKAACALLAFTA